MFYSSEGNKLQQHATAWLNLRNNERKKKLQNSAYNMISFKNKRFVLIKIKK